MPGRLLAGAIGWKGVSDIMSAQHKYKGKKSEVPWRNAPVYDRALPIQTAGRPTSSLPTRVNLWSGLEVHDDKLTKPRVTVKTNGQLQDTGAQAARCHKRPVAFCLSARRSDPRPMARLIGAVS